MIRRLQFLLAASAFITSQALADPHTGNTGPYLSIHGGATFLSIEEKMATLSFEPGFLVGGAVGYKSAPTGLRPEAEITYRQSNISKVTLDNFNVDLHGYSGNLSYMANLYIDVNMCSPLTLYLGGGAGISQNRGKASYDFGDAKSLGISRNFCAQGAAYQVITGFDYSFNTCFDLGFEYRYFQAHHRGIEHDIGVTLKRYY